MSVGCCECLRRRHGGPGQAGTPEREYRDELAVPSLTHRWQAARPIPLNKLFCIGTELLSVNVMDGSGGCLSSCHYSPRRRRKSSSLYTSYSSSSTSSSWCHGGAEGRETGDPPPTWVYMTVWVAGVLVYVNGLTGDFVHDDVSAIKTNPDVLGTNPLSQVFCNDYWGKPLVDPRSHKSYRPFTILTFR